MSQRSVTARAAHSAEHWRHRALFMAKPSNELSMTKQSRVALALRLDAALEAAEDGHVAGLRVGRVSTTRGNVARMAAKVASLAWMLAMSQRRIHACPSLD